MVFTLAFAAVALPDAVMLSACLVLTLAVLTFVFWIEPDEVDSRSMEQVRRIIGPANDNPVK